MATHIDISDLCRAVTYWLNYKQLTGLRGLFSEASLTVPIAEFLSTKRLPIVAEKNHPAFGNIRGRPRQLDFVAYKDNDKWSFVIETKFFPTTIQSLINDIGRLLLLEKPGCEKYIVIALPVSNNIRTSFRKNMNVAGKRVNVLKTFFSRTKGKSRIVNIRNAPAEVAKLFQNFMADYELDEIPNAFEIKCINFTRTKYFAAGIWRISLRRGTGRISEHDI